MAPKGPLRSIRKRLSDANWTPFLVNRGRPSYLPVVPACLKIRCREKGSLPNRYESFGPCQLRSGTDGVLLSARNYMAPRQAKLQRGGPPTYRSYYDAPGGVMVEVSTMNIAEPS
jgi:hypothetical protein